MNLLFKKSISLVVSMCLIFTLISSNVFAESNNVSDTTTIENGNPDVVRFNLHQVQNDKDKIVIKGEYEGDEAYATLDKKTNEITMQTIEYKKNPVTKALLSLIVGEDKSDKKVTNYKVKVEKANQEEKRTELVATITDTGTNKEFKIDNTKVKAQLGIALGLGEILGEALVAYLIRISAVGVAGFVIASTISSTLKNKTPNYYEAKVDYALNDVVIGNPIDEATAKNRTNSGSDVWSKNQVIAFNLASNYGSPIGPEIHGDGEVGYYLHYHAAKTLAMKNGRGVAHLFFS